MNDGNTKTERLNRTRIEWMKFLKPFEYMLLDKMLFQSNLTHANNGQGYLFHVRTLAEETGMANGTVSKIIKGWSFVTKTGLGKAMKIQLNYPAFEKWIVHQVNNDRSPHEPRSKNKNNSTVPNSFVHQVNNGNNLIKIDSSGARSDTMSGVGFNTPEGSGSLSLNGINAVSPAGPSDLEKEKTTATGTNSPIVHQVNENQPTRYVVCEPAIIDLIMPKRIAPGPSAARQAEIIRQLNAGGHHFIMDNPMGSERDGFRFCAIDEADEAEKYILITADHKDYINRMKVQEMCRYFRKQKYRIMLWTGEDQAIFKVAKEKSAPVTCGS